MSGAGLGYSIVDARATFATYSNATKILAAKSDTGTAVTESDTATKAGSIWADQIDDFIDEVNQLVTGNLAFAGPTLFGGTSLAPNVDSTTSLGLTGKRWSDFFTDAMTCGGTVSLGTGASHIVRTSVGASGTAEFQVDDGTNQNDGGWFYNTTANYMGMKAGNTHVTSMVSTQFYPQTDSAVSLGTTANRWSDFFTDAMTCGGTATLSGDLNHDGANVGFYGTAPAAQSSAYTRTATVVESRVLAASASATATNNNNVLAALIADLQAIGLLG